MTYWTVRANGAGWNRAQDLYFLHYENAKAESRKDYRDKPVKHTVTAEHFREIPYDIFEDFSEFDYNIMMCDFVEGWCGL